MSENTKNKIPSRGVHSGQRRAVCVLANAVPARTGHFHLLQRDLLKLHKHQLCPSNTRTTHGSINSTASCYLSKANHESCDTVLGQTASYSPDVTRQSTCIQDPHPISHQALTLWKCWLRRHTDCPLYKSHLVNVTMSYLCDAW